MSTRSVIYAFDALTKSITSIIFTAGISDRTRIRLATVGNTALYCTLNPIITIAIRKTLHTNIGIRVTELSKTTVSIEQAFYACITLLITNACRTISGLEALNAGGTTIAGEARRGIRIASEIGNSRLFIIFTDDTGRSTTCISVTDCSLLETACILSPFSMIDALDAHTGTITHIAFSACVCGRTIIVLTELIKTKISSTLYVIVTVRIGKTINTSVVFRVTSITFITVAVSEALYTDISVLITDAGRTVCGLDALNTGGGTVTGETSRSISIATKVGDTGLFIIFTDNASWTSGSVSITDRKILQTTRILSSLYMIHTLYTAAGTITGIVNATGLSGLAIRILASIGDAAVCGAL